MFRNLNIATTNWNYLKPSKRRVWKCSQELHFTGPVKRMSMTVDTLAEGAANLVSPVSYGYI